MRSALGGPRLLLRRLREISAEPINAQARLDKIVVQIAANMVAEVCSVYVLRADQSLELYATEGLKREAVHLTTIEAGEGLVGLIAKTAEPLALSEAQEHPAFSYHPETGEEIYHSFLGVPILRGGATVGVLVVQNKVRRSYSEEEVEALQTTAMLLAEMIASGELQSIAKSAELLALNSPRSMRGAPICDGVGLGYVVLHEFARRREESAGGGRGWRVAPSRRRDRGDAPFDRRARRAWGPDGRGRASRGSPGHSHGRQ